MCISAGVNDNAINAEIITEMAMVIANCWYKRPTIPGIKPTGTNTAAKYQGYGNNRRRNILHGLISSFFGRHIMIIYIMLHRLHHDNSIIHHDTYGQHKAKHGKCIDGKAQWDEKAKSTQYRYRNGKHRNKR